MRLLCPMVLVLDVRPYKLCADHAAFHRDGLCVAGLLDISDGPGQHENADAALYRLCASPALCVCSVAGSTRSDPLSLHCVRRTRRLHVFRSEHAHEVWPELCRLMGSVLHVPSCQLAFGLSVGLHGTRRSSGLGVPPPVYQMRSVPVLQPGDANHLDRNRCLRRRRRRPERSQGHGRRLRPGSNLPAIGTYALAASSLSGIWALQLVVQRLEALQAGFGESLPDFRLILWLARVNVLWIWLLAFSVRVSTALTLGLGCAAALCILSMMCLMFRALSSPLRVLLDCTPEGSDGVSEHLHKEVSFAVRIIHQAQLGIFLSNVSVSFRLVTAAAVAHFGSRVWWDAYQYGCMVDGLGNGLCLLLLSGGKLHLQNFSLQRQVREPSSAGLGSQDLPECTCESTSTSSGPRKACERCGWFAKVEELALRRISAERLLDFHARLGAPKGPLMPHFDPKISTTSDVVRHAIIPESRQGELGSALASVWKCPSSSLGPRMVTHHWQNRFKDLVAVVVADGLGLKRWDGIALELEERHEEALQERLAARGSGQWQYWICAFCVNQHASICGNAMGGSDSVTREVYPTCDCRTPKFFNDQPVQCELNKFDDMMLFLKNRHPYYLQVVATDTDFTIFSRAFGLS